jgi:TPP-dependent pyruvate/acetoin dehydrogenase alpha subunit
MGSAFEAQHRDRGVVTVGFFGEGATGQGVLWESLLLSANWKLPVVWVCENNQYAVNTPIDRSLPTVDLRHLITDELMPACQVDGNDVAAVALSAKNAVERARNGGGPSLIEAMTYRRTWHSFRYSKQPDSRPEDEQRYWMDRDPIERLRLELVEAGIADDEALHRIDDEINRDLSEAVAFAEASPFPELASLSEMVYSSSSPL